MTVLCTDDVVVRLKRCW